MTWTRLARFCAATTVLSCSSEPVTPRAPGLSLVVTSATPAGFVGEPLTPVIDVAVRLPGGALHTEPLFIEAALAAGPGALEGNTSVQAVAGVARFDSLQITSPGSHQVRFTSPGATPATLSVQVATPAPPLLAILSQPPGPHLTGTQLPAITVELRDHRGRRTADTTRVSVAVAQGGGSLAGVTSVSPLNGVASFGGLTISGAGSHVLAFTASGYTGANSGTLLITVPPPRPAPLGRIAFTGVSVLPMDLDRVLTGYTVLVDSSRITALGPDGTVALAPGTTLIDGTGHWLMPGLTDTHTHEHPFGTWPADEGGNFIMMLANGITSIWNMGDFTGVLLPVRDEIRAGRMVGPAIHVGRFARAPSEGGGPTTVVATPAQAQALVLDALARGYDFIKPYSALSTDVFTALLNSASAAGLPVMGHAVVSYGLLNGLQNGQHMAVHISDFYFTVFGSTINDGAIPGVVATVAGSGAWIGSTLHVMELIRDFGLDALAGRDQWSRVLSRDGVEFMHEGAIAQWQAMLQQRADIRVATDRTAAVAFMQRFTKALGDAGVPLLLGTDEIGIPGVVPGFAIHDEIRMLLGTGLTPWQVLATGTSNPGRFAQQFMNQGERHGTVEPGSRADLLLLDADPRADISTLRRPAGVMAAGRYYPGAWLRAQLDTLRLTR